MLQKEVVANQQGHAHGVIQIPLSNVTLGNYTVSRSKCGLIRIASVKVTQAVGQHSDLAGTALLLGIS